MPVRVFTFVLLLAVMHSQPASAQNNGNATVPLGDILALYESSKPEMEIPPTPAALERIVIKSRLLRGALKMTAHVRLTVLTDDWVRVPLFTQNRGLTITEVQEIENGNIVVEDGLVSFVSRAPGSYHFKVELQQKAAKNVGNWRAEFRSFPATVLRMELQHDNTSFEVAHDMSEVDGDSLFMLPRNGVFSVVWKEKRLPKVPKKIQSRPKIQPVIEEAFADIVSTLDGQRISRYRYNLRLQGSQSLTLSIPSDQHITKVFLNSISMPFEVENNVLVTMVSPPQVGGESATLEIVTQTGALPYSLSGNLSFVLPSPSWDLNHQYVTLHLPDVFNYTRKGGSLGLSDTPMSTKFIHKIPTPGKVVYAKQQLVIQNPHIGLEYTVDLEGRYYRGYPQAEKQEIHLP